MRLTIILLIAGCLQVSAKGYGQKITISGKDLPLEKVFSMVRNQTGYVFFYDYAIFQNAKTVSLDIKQGNIEDVLNACFKGQGLEYKIENKTISITKKNEIPSAQQSVAPPAADHDVVGLVKNESGAPLAGATITILKLKKIVTTNEKGEFIFQKIPDGKYQVDISFIGYDKFRTEILVSDNTAGIDVSLKQATNELDKAVVIPYGTTTQRLNVGNISTVTSKEIEAQPVTSVLEALEGRVPGLVISQTTGLPGGSFKVLIRGQNSILNGTDPYYVVDGVPYNSQLPASPLNFYEFGGSPLNYLNPYDIESIEVLKDADATAIYGSKAANGAILITTKKGKAGAVHFDINLNTGITNPARTMAELNTTQYLAMRHEAFYNDSIANPAAKIKPKPSDYDVNGVWNTTRNTNWSKVMTNKPAQFTDAEASVSGGSTNMQFLIGAGYNVQKTGFPTLISGDGGNKRASLHFNISTFSPNKRFRLSLTGDYSSTKNTVQSVDLTNAILGLAPDAPPIFNLDGSLDWAPKVPGQIGTWSNPYAVLYQKLVSNTSNLTSNLDMSYALLKGLEIKTGFGYGFIHAEESHLIPTTIYDPARRVPSGSALFATSNGINWIAEPQVNYRLQLGKSVLSTLIGATFQGNNNNSTSQNGYGFISDALLGDLGAASTVQGSTNSSQNKYEALFARINFDWADKYILDLNGRRDGTTRFGPGKQFGNFGAIGAGWIFTKEEFFPKTLSFLSFGKLRGSYGITGSDQIGDYQYISLYGLVGSVPYQGFQGLAPQSLFNPDLEWESTRKLEGGIQLGFWHDRVTFQASIYRNRSNNQLVQTPVSYVTGFNQIASNLPALVQNSGKEFEINAIIVKTREFTWSGSFNIGINRNKLIAFPGLDNSPYAGTYFVGKSLGTIPVYHYMGVNDTTGLYQVETLQGGTTSKNGSNIDNTHYLDKLKGTFAGGFGSNLSYKGFSLNLFFQITKQINKTLVGLRESARIDAEPTYGSVRSLAKAWRQKTLREIHPERGSLAARAFQLAEFSDFAYGDASFIRLKTAAISWQMPQAMAKKIGLRSVAIQLNGQNLLTITKYDGADPETQSTTTGPRRAMTAGLQIGL